METESKVTLHNAKKIYFRLTCGSLKIYFNFKQPNFEGYCAMDSVT